ncbi:MAG: YdbL family protein [Sphingomonadales bacterium]|nr:YdbL family protein [Sphingomonadales bacterium]
MTSFAKIVMATAAVAVLAGAGAAAAFQRDPAYDAARKSGAIGEKPDGYLGFVTPPTPALRAMVDDINIKRKAAYTQRASATNSTVEQFAFTTGCNLIAKTEIGEKYMSPDGVWRTRDASPPVRDSRCL